MIDLPELQCATEPIEVITVGMRVVADERTDKRGGRREIRGTVEYVSRFGWATVRLDAGYRKCFWLVDLNSIEILD